MPTLFWYDRRPGVDPEVDTLIGSLGRKGIMCTFAGSEGALEPEMLSHTARSLKDAVIALVVDVANADELALLTMLRAVNVHAPCIVLLRNTIAVSKLSKLRASMLEQGAQYCIELDDYGEVAAIVGMLCSRFMVRDAGIVVTGNISIDLGGGRVFRTVDNHPLPITAHSTEWRFLALLAQRKGKSVALEELQAYIYGAANHQRLDNIKYRLCQKLASAVPGGADYIINNVNAYTLRDLPAS